MKDLRTLDRAGPLWRLGIAVAVLFVASAWAVPAVEANSGADATILNVVRVDYKDSSGNQSFAATASSSVTINLVEAALTISGRPTGAAPGDTAALPGEQTVSSGATATYLYALTANANGDDIYDLSVAKDATANVVNDTVNWDLMEPDGTTVLVAGDPATATLGASVITDVLSATQLQFPGGTLTNIAVDDVVVVDGDDYLVTAVTLGTGASHDNPGGAAHNDVGNTTAETAGTLTLAANPDGSNQAPNFAAGLIGEVVGEQVLLRASVYAETDSGADGTVDFDITTAPDGDAGESADVADVTTTFSAVALTIQKDVRNVTQAGAFAATATGDPGETLEYRVTIANSGSDATDVTVTDAVPEYTSLVTHVGSYGAGGGAGAAADYFGQVDDGGTTSDLTMQNTDTEDNTVGSGDAAGTSAGDALTIYVGTGNTNASGGTVDNATTYTIIYQVQID